MCRSITILRGLEPAATAGEIEDAARQFVRKVAGLQSTSQMARDDVRHAIEQITLTTQELLLSLPPRRSVPPDPPRRGRPGQASDI